MKKHFYRDKDWIEKKYCKEKLSVMEIADLCEVRKQTIYKWIYQFELTRDPVFPRRSKSRYSLDERYFENINNGNKAYWLGFIAADGCVVNKEGRRIFFIELARKDRNHLEKFKEEIKYEGPLYDLERKNRNALSSKIQIASCRMVQDLVKHGIIPNKTKFLKAPDIDPKLYHHWIRGLFDGDGSISNRKSGHTGGEFFGTRAVIEFVVNHIPGTNKVSKKKKYQGYYHAFGGASTVKKIYKYLYKDADIYLKRKKDKFFS